MALVRGLNYSITANRLLPNNYSDLLDDEVARKTMREALGKVNRAMKRTEKKWLRRVSINIDMGGGGSRESLLRK